MANTKNCETSSSTDEEMPGEDNMWCPLLCAAYHYYIGEYLAQYMCYCSRANVSQTCHFAVFINPIERESIDQFFHRFENSSERDNVASRTCSSGNEVNGVHSSAVDDFETHQPITIDEETWIVSIAKFLTTREALRLRTVANTFNNDYICSWNRVAEFGGLMTSGCRREQGVL